MPVRSRGARERFMRQGSLGAGFGLGATPVIHHTARRQSAQDTAALRNRRRSTLRRQTARDLIAEEEEELTTGPTLPAADVNTSDLFIASSFHVFKYFTRVTLC